MVDIQTTLQFLQGAINWDNMVVITRIETQGVDLFHFDGKVFIIKLAVFGEKFEHSCQDATGELEILVLRESDASQVGNNDHAFAVT